MARKDALLALHKLLVVRRDALRRALAGDISLLKEMGTSGGSGDSADIAMDLTQNEVSSKLAELESRELGRIERAIEKLKDGSFGSCENCNRKIPMARLNALPYTTTCVSCQRLSEQYGTGDSEHQEDWQRVYDNEPRSDNVKLSDIEFGLSKNGS